MIDSIPMIYVSQAHLPISYVQLNFSIQHTEFNSALAYLKPETHQGLQSSALRIMSQRQLQRGTLNMGRATFINEIEALGTEIQLTHRGYAHSLGAVALTRTLPRLIKLFHDALTKPSLDKEELEQSKRAYISELEARYDDDQSLAWLWLLRRLHQDHPLWADYCIEAKHITVLSTDHIRQAWPFIFNRKCFLPSFTSDATQDTLAHLIDPLYNDLNINSGESQFQACRLPSLAKLSKSTLTLVNKPGKQQALLFIAHPTIAPTHPQALALYVALCALGGTFSAPLMQEIRVKRGLSYGAHAGIKGEAHSRYVCLHCSPEAPQATQALLVMLQVYQRGGRGELSDTEINFAKSYLINAHPFSIETPAMRAGLSANACLMGLDPKLLLTQADRIKKLSIDEIRQAAQDLLASQGLEILVFGDQKQIGTQLINELQSILPLEQVLRLEAKDEPTKALTRRSLND